MTKDKQESDKQPSWTDARWVSFMVWTLRVAVGAVFVFSGLVKAIDLWGAVFKFEEYFTAWDFEIPLSLTVLGAMMLSSAEFVLGCLVATGCFRRLSVWALSAMMAVMLPLTFYIWLKDPVSDCGCFGDFLKLSNGATFAKNIAITLALVFLLIANRKAKSLYHPYSQWLNGVASLVFVTFVELYGFNVQPMLDFRSFPEGTSLLVSDGDAQDDSEFEFVYEKNGEQQVFTTDSLPDSTWTFVDRRVVGGGLGVDEASSERTELIVTDSDGADVTEDVISPEGLEMLVIVPQHERAEMFYNSFTNELYAMMNENGGSLVELTNVPSDSINDMRDDYMAEFPVYHAESTVLKELSRGVVSVVLLKDGVIQWKRNMGSIDVEGLVAQQNPVARLPHLKPEGKELLVRWSEILLAFMAALLLVDKTVGFAINRRKNGEAEKNFLNLQKEKREAEQADREA